MLKTSAVKRPNSCDKETHSLQSVKLQKLKTEAKKTAIKNQEHFTLCTPYNVDSKSHMSVTRTLSYFAHVWIWFSGEQNLTCENCVFVAAIYII